MPSSLSSCHLGGQWQQLCPHFSLYPPPYLQHTSRIWRAKRCRSCWIRTWTHTVVTSSLFRRAQRCLLFRMASSKHSTSTGLSWKSRHSLPARVTKSGAGELASPCSLSSLRNSCILQDQLCQRRTFRVTPMSTGFYPRLFRPITQGR